MKNSTKYSLLLVFMFCCSCISSTSQLNTTEDLITHTSEVEEITPTIASTSKPSISPLFTSTPKNKLPDLSEIPSWLSDSSSSVVHLSGYGSGVKHIFIHAESAESYYFSPPDFAKGHFFDGSSIFGLFSLEYGKIYYLDFHTRQVSEADYASENIRTIGDVSGYRELVMRSGSPESVERVLFRDVDSEEISSYGTYIFNHDSDEGEWTTRVYDTLSGESVYESNPQDGLWDIEAAWSPTNDRYIAIVKGEMNTQQDPFYVLSTKVEIIDVLSKSVVSRFSGDFGNIEWSDNGEKILYIDSRSLYWNYGEHFQGSPCILDIANGSRDCLDAIPNTHFQTEFDDFWIFRVDWGSDDRYIYYIMYYNLSADETSYICRYDLVTADIVCPDVDESVFGDNVVLGYSVSPGDNFLYLGIRPYGPGAGGPIASAITSIDSSVAYIINPIDFGLDEETIIADIFWLPPE